MECKDCGIQITKYSTRCKMHASLFRTQNGGNNHLVLGGKDNPNFKHGRNCLGQKCSICREELATGGGKGNTTGKCKNCYYKNPEWRKAISDRILAWVATGKHHFGDGSKRNRDKWSGRKTLAYREWRRSVFVRDNYTCQECGQRGGKIQADHIKPYSLYPTLRHKVENGRTLCVACHRKTPTYGFGVLKLVKQNNI